MTAQDIEVGNAIVPYIGNGLWLIPGRQEVNYNEALMVANEMAKIMEKWRA